MLNRSLHKIQQNIQFFYHRSFSETHQLPFPPVNPFFLTPFNSVQNPRPSLRSKSGTQAPPASLKSISNIRDQAFVQNPLTCNRLVKKKNKLKIKEKETKKDNVLSAGWTTAAGCNNVWITQIYLKRDFSAYIFLPIAK